MRLATTTLRPVDPGRRRPKPKVNGLVGVSCLVGDPVRFVSRPLEHGLGQRRSLVRELTLFTDQCQLAFVSLISKRYGGRGSCQGRLR